MLSWTVMTPYYSEDVIYSKKDCLTSPAASSTDGVTTMLYLQVSQCTRWQDSASVVGSVLSWLTDTWPRCRLLLQTLYKSDWKNFLERMGLKDDSKVRRTSHVAPHS